MTGSWIDIEGTYTKLDQDDYADKEVTVNTSILFTTGATDRNSAMNIYDLAGNVWEWTLEQTSFFLFPYVLRGGSFECVGTDSASKRFMDGTTGTASSTYYTGFRATLY